MPSQELTTGNPWERYLGFEEGNVQTYFGDVGDGFRRLWTKSNFKNPKMQLKVLVYPDAYLALRTRDVSPALHILEL
jgi:hypothetical protein